MPDSYDLTIDGQNMTLNWDRPTPPSSSDIEGIVTQYRTSHRSAPASVPQAVQPNLLDTYKSKYLGPNDQSVPRKLLDQMMLAHVTGQPPPDFPAGFSDVGKQALQREMQSLYANQQAMGQGTFETPYSGGGPRIPLGTVNGQRIPAVNPLPQSVQQNAAQSKGPIGALKQFGVGAFDPANLSLLPALGSGVVGPAISRLAGGTVAALAAPGIYEDIKSGRDVSGGITKGFLYGALPLSHEIGGLVRKTNGPSPAPDIRGSVPDLAGVQPNGAEASTTAGDAAPPPLISLLGREYEQVGVGKNGKPILKLKKPSPEVHPYGPAPETPVSPGEGQAPPFETAAKNASTAEERTQMNLPQRDLPTPENQQMWLDEAKSKIASGEIKPEELAKTAAKKPVSLDDVQTTALTLEKARLITEHNTAIDRANNAIDKGNTSGHAEAMSTAADIEKQFNTVADALEKSGTEWGRTGVARQLTIDQDLSLVNQKRIARANKGADLTPQDTAAIENAVSGVDKARDAINAPVNAVIDAVKKTTRQDVIKSLQDEFEGLKNEFLSKTSRLNAGLDPELAVIVGKMGLNIAKRTGLKAADVIESVYNEVKDHAPYITRDHIRDAIVNTKRLDAYKTRTTKTIADIEAGTTKPARKPLQMDEEAKQLQMDLTRARVNLKQTVEGMKKPHWTDTAIQVKRAAILAGTKVLGKITTAAATLRPITEGLEDIIGAGASQVPGLKKVFSNAPTEGHFGWKNMGEAKIAAWKQVFSKQTFKDVQSKFPIGEMVKAKIEKRPTTATGMSSLDLNYLEKTGKWPEGAHKPNFLDLPGLSHAAIKEPIREGVAAKADVKVREWQKRNGIDPDSVDGQAQRTDMAYQSGARAILQQDNTATDLWNSVLGRAQSMAEKSDNIATRTMMRGAKFAARNEVPILKVPSNFIAEGQLYGTGGVNAALISAVKKFKGEALTPEEADIVARAIKKQGLGAGVLAAGWFGYKAVQGFYAPENKPKGKHKAMDIDFVLNGVKVHIPGNYTHSAALYMLDAGATARRTWNQTHKVQDAAYRTARGAISEHPFYRNVENVSNAAEGISGLGKILGNEVTIWMPRFIAERAQSQDVDAAGNPISRSPRGFKDQVKMSIPGQRQYVPTKAQRAAIAAVQAAARR